MTWTEEASKILRLVGSWATQNPMWSGLILVFILLFFLVLSHLFDLKEGNFRNAMLWFVLILILVIAVVIFLVAVRDGYLLSGFFGES